MTVPSHHPTAIPFVPVVEVSTLEGSPALILVSHNPRMARQIQGTDMASWLEALQEVGRGGWA